MLFVMLMLACFILLWAIANKQQKVQINEWYILIAKPIARLGIAVPESLLPEVVAQQPQQQKKQTIPYSNQQEPRRPIICGRVKSEDIDHQYKVYEWQDLKGQTQISDRPPSSDYINLHVRELYAENFFNLSIDSRLADLPAFTQNNIQAGVTKTYKTLSDVIKVAQLRKIDLKLKFISDKNQFHTYRMQVAPDSSNKATGFYTSRLNQSTIWAVGNKDHMTRISLHESSHAIVAAMFGDIPIWLNEGMAGFFEKMVITGEQTYTFATNDEHFQLLRQNHLPSLRSHFGQSHSQWNNPNNSDLNYAIDWSLFFYLMIHSEGRQFLRYMLDDLAVNYCQKFDAIGFIDSHYKGGLNRLESDWRQWLKTAPSGTVTF
jgi:hypothetical protein